MHIILSFLLFILLSIPHLTFAAPGEYYTVTWVKAESSGHVSFKLADGHHYTCSSKATPRQCLSILLTALAADREVKAKESGSKPGTGDQPHIVKSLKIH